MNTKTFEQRQQEFRNAIKFDETEHIYMCSFSNGKDFKNKTRSMTDVVKTYGIERSIYASGFRKGSVRIDDAASIGEEDDFTDLERKYGLRHYYYGKRNYLLQGKRVTDKLRAFKPNNVDDEEDLILCDHLMSIAVELAHAEVQHIRDDVTPENISDDNHPWNSQLTTTNKDWLALADKAVDKLVVELTRLKEHKIILDFLLDRDLDIFVFRIVNDDATGYNVGCTFPILHDYFRAKLTAKIGYSSTGQLKRSTGHIFRLYYEWKRFIDFFNEKESERFIDLEDHESDRGSITSDEVNRWHKDQGFNDSDIFEPGNPDDLKSRKSVYPTEDDEDGFAKPIKGRDETFQHFNIRMRKYTKDKKQFLDLLDKKLREEEEEKNRQSADKGKGKAQDDDGKMDGESDFPDEQTDIIAKDYKELLFLLKKEHPEYIDTKESRTVRGHRSRFGDRHGVSQLVSPRKIVDEDWIIELDRGRNDRQRFVVTFGEAGWFPIFNKIDE